MNLRHFVPVLVLMGLALVPTSASASITGTVYVDYNSNGANDAGGFVSGVSTSATDAALSGVVVTAYNADGAVAGTTATDAYGVYSLTPTGSGPYRIQFVTPSGYQPSFRGSQNGTSIQFVANADAVNVNFGVVNVGEYCQDNPRLVTCLMPLHDVATTQPTRQGAVSFPAAFTGQQQFDRRGVVDPLNAETNRIRGGTETESGVANLGCTYGVGVDKAGFAYFGTYVKRHCPYGPAGAVNAIYRVNLATGETSTFAVLGAATLPAHNPNSPSGFLPYSVDGLRSASPGTTYYASIYPNVGRAGLGDVDVTTDGATLLAIEMTQAAPILWMVGTADPTIRAALPIPNPVTAPATSFNGVSCVGPFHPMGIGVRGERIVIGGVCGGDETRFVDPGTSRTEAAAFVMELNAARTGFTTVAATTLDFNKGGAYLGHRLLAWDHGEWNNDFVTGLWRNWSDAAPVWQPDAQPYYPAWPTPMLSDISIMDDGDLVLAFRDRWGDQNAERYRGITYEWNGTGTPRYLEQIVLAGHLLRMCAGSNGFTRESAATCNGTTGAGLIAGEGSLMRTATTAERNNSPAYYALGWWGADYNGGLGAGSTQACANGANCAWHPYTSHGSIASLPGSRTIWANTWDVNQYYQMGVRALGPCDARSAEVGACGPAGVEDGAMIGGLVLTHDPTEADPYAFSKGNGLGDLEVVCDAAPVQIGNRVWIDTNNNGIQDPGEPVAAGVTVRLYDAGGTLVGTAVTDSDGAYYFSSTASKPAAGDGSNTGGGLVAGVAFRVALNNPADYAVGGPLHGYALTTGNVTTQGSEANSKATMVAGYPSIDIPARTAGQNNHTFDIGFYPSAADAKSDTTKVVAVGDYVWLDTNRNAIQDAGEKPLKGVQVTLLTPDGKRAKNAAGKVVPVKRTDANGYYVFDGLLPGRYKVQFLLPNGYRFTVPKKGNTKKDSNPRAATDNPLRGVTPVFRVHAAVKDNTIRNRNTKIDASFIDPTIDAGVVRYTPAPNPSPVTG